MPWSARELAALTDDDLAQRRIWGYRMAGPARIEDLDVLHRNGEVRLRDARDVTFRLLRVDLDASSQAAVRDALSE